MPDFIKKFFDWFYLKVYINSKETDPPFFNEGEIWWCYVGENVGTEIRGKGDLFTRPVFIFKKYDSYSFLGLPLSTKNKKGSWYVDIAFSGRNQTVILAQGKVMHYKRFKEKMGQVDLRDRLRIEKGYKELHIKK